LFRAGFDPTAGVFHVDDLHRDSLAYDIMEAVRPDVDLWLLDFMRGHKFSAKDYYVKKDGGTRLILKITPYLAEILSLWAKKIEAVVKNILIILMNDEK
jgi:CRISPR-associated protein Cas1